MIPIDTNTTTEYGMAPRQKIHPIRKYCVHLTRKTLQKHSVKNIASKVWNFKSDEYGDSKTDLRRFFKMFKASKTSKVCHRLNLEFQECTNMNNQDISLVSQELKRIASLEKFSLDFNPCLRVNDQGLEALALSLKQVPTLKSLDLKLRQWKNVTNDGIQSLCKGLSVLKGLKEMILVIKGSREYLAVKYLIDYLKELDSIEKVSFDLDSLKSGYNVESLMQYLKRFEFLKSLEINLSGCIDLTGHNFGFFSAHLMELKSLRSFKLDVSRNTISEMDLQNLAEGLRELKNLSALDLDFSDCRSVSNDGLRYLSQSLQKLASVKKMSLKLQYNDMISSDGLYYLAQALPNMLHLYLDLSGCRSIAKRGFLNLARGLKKAVFLQSLDLSFAFCPLLSDVCLKAITNGLHGLVALQTLILAFDYCEKITAKGLQDLGKTLQSLTSLQDLRLSFVSCANINSIELKCISEGLKTCSGLQDLYLGFARCDNLTDDGLHNLAEGLEGLGNLQSLFLNFLDCERITEQGFESVAKSFKELSKLKSLKIIVQGRKQLTTQVIETLLMSCEELNGLETLDLCTKDGIQWEGYNQLIKALKVRFPYIAISIQQWMSAQPPIIA